MVACVLLLRQVVVGEIEFRKLVHDLQLLHVDKVFLGLLNGRLDVDSGDLKSLFVVRKVGKG